jgi:Tol biopolymer transport system component
VFDRDLGNGTGARDLVQKPANGGAETVLYSDQRPKWPLSFSSDGRFLAFVTVNPRTGQDVEVLPLTGTERKPIPFQAVPGIKSYPRFSPDGRWVAFGSDEAGGNEIYVAPFPGPDVRQVSAELPRWRRDGKELFTSRRPDDRGRSDQRPGTMLRSATEATVPDRTGRRRLLPLTLADGWRICR